MEYKKPPQAASAFAGTLRLQGLCKSWLLGQDSNLQPFG